jgi:hypothetical protein
MWHFRLMLRKGVCFPIDMLINAMLFRVLIGEITMPANGPMRFR